MVITYFSHFLNKFFTGKQSSTRLQNHCLSQGLIAKTSRETRALENKPTKTPETKSPSMQVNGKKIRLDFENVSTFEFQRKNSMPLKLFEFLEKYMIATFLIT